MKTDSECTRSGRLPTAAGATLWFANTKNSEVTFRRAAGGRGVCGSETPLAPGQAWEGRKEHAVDRT
jgi:hypothetical protein